MDLIADPSPEQASGSSPAAIEAARLAEEERRLSEREAHVEGHEKAQVGSSVLCSKFPQALHLGHHTVNSPLLSFRSVLQGLRFYV